MASDTPGERHPEDNETTDSGTFPQCVELLEDFDTVIRRASVGIVVIQDGKFVFVNPMVAQWTGYAMDELLDHEFSMIVFPEDQEKVTRNYENRVAGKKAAQIYEVRLINRDQNVRWVEIHASVIQWWGRPAALGFLMDVTRRKEMETDLQKKDAEIHTLIRGSLQALGAALEKRDPYTAGHQARVADLCVKIGKMLGLSGEQLTGLFLAASIHDIGKIYIPAEILNRPGKLTDLEFSMVKTHAEIGYEILKPIEFEYPIAQIVLQHHERLDGSGYPNALQGDEISLEARILAVADVVEAMASHRPYRAALGVVEALRELQRFRGTGFDEDVVDACMEIFSEGYHFPTIDTTALIWDTSKLKV